ncbi:MAG: tetratricopeptide repeat protein [bacterium]
MSKKNNKDSKQQKNIPTKAKDDISTQTNSGQEGFVGTINKFYYIFILGFIIAVYSQVLNFIFTGFDDDFLVVNNLQNLLRASFQDVFMGNSFLTDAVSGFYRPIQTITFMMDTQIGGGLMTLHLTNLILFYGSSILLYKLLRKFEFDALFSLIATLIYSMHPLFSINVAWLPARGDLLITLFGLASFIHFIDYIHTKKTRNLFYLNFFLLLAFFSKETALLIPCLMFLYVIIFRVKSNRQEIFNLIILWGIVYGLWIYLRFSFSGSLPENQIFGLIPFIENLRTIPEYISKFILPLNIMSLPVFTLGTTVIGIIIIVLLLIVINLKKDNKILRQTQDTGRGEMSVQRMLLFWTSWFVLLVLPGMLYSRYYPKSEMFYHYLDHRAFLPMIGFVIVLMTLIEPYLKKIKQKKLLIYGIVLTIALSIYSFNHVKTFTEPIRFLSDAIEGNPKASVAYFLRGNYWKDSGEMDKAINDYTRSVSIDKNYAEAYNNRGSAYGFLGDNFKAIKDLTKAIKLEPDIPDGYFNRAIARDAIGDFKGAVNDFTKSLAITPNDYVNYYLRANAFNSLREKEKAIDDYSRAIQLNANFPDAYLNRANLLYQVGESKAACSDWKKAVELGSEQAEQMMERYCNSE